MYINNIISVLPTAQIVPNTQSLFVYFFSLIIRNCTGIQSPNNTLILFN